MSIGCGYDPIFIAPGDLNGNVAKEGKLDCVPSQFGEKMDIERSVGMDDGRIEPPQ